MTDEGAAHKSVLGLMAAGVAWPSVYGAIAYAIAPPLDRAILSAWCGAAPHGDALAFLGHCANCWGGAAAFFSAAALIALSIRRPARQAGV